MNIWRHYMVNIIYTVTYTPDWPNIRFFHTRLATSSWLVSLWVLIHRACVWCVWHTSNRWLINDSTCSFGCWELCQIMQSICSIRSGTYTWSFTPEIVGKILMSPTYSHIFAIFFCGYTIVINLTSIFPIFL